MNYAHRSGLAKQCADSKQQLGDDVADGGGYDEKRAQASVGDVVGDGGGDDESPTNGAGGRR